MALPTSFVSIPVLWESPDAGESWGCAGGYAARTPPNPPFIEMLLNVHKKGTAL